MDDIRNSREEGESEREANKKQTNKPTNTHNDILVKMNIHKGVGLLINLKKKKEVGGTASYKPGKIIHVGFLLHF